ncbi:hypothetical protein ES332_D04G173200v1 [Gossypium tomentosum]|uniref:Uncharacterized protein n=1 Tax=Gossypium tomentosum TaxID=34277 RepID=A0A5D2LEB2_GOSTO|nr:hypothetical protein ES332_D04G173200v1 [Gossypium tomentosum]
MMPIYNIGVLRDLNTIQSYPLGFTVFAMRVVIFTILVSPFFLGILILFSSHFAGNFNLQIRPYCYPKTFPISAHINLFFLPIATPSPPFVVVPIISFFSLSHSLFVPILAVVFLAKKTHFSSLKNHVFGCPQLAFKNLFWCLAKSSPSWPIMVVCRPKPPLGATEFYYFYHLFPKSF